MPWESRSMWDEKVRFIAECLLDREPMTVLCERFGIARQTGHQLKRRYLLEGAEGLKARPAGAASAWAGDVGGPDGADSGAAAEQALLGAQEALGDPGAGGAGRGVAGAQFGVGVVEARGAEQASADAAAAGELRISRSPRWRGATTPGAWTSRAGF